MATERPPHAKTGQAHRVCRGPSGTGPSPAPAAPGSAAPAAGEQNSHTSSVSLQGRAFSTPRGNPSRAASSRHCTGVRKSFIGARAQLNPSLQLLSSWLPGHCSALPSSSWHGCECQPAERAAQGGCQPAAEHHTCIPVQNTTWLLHSKAEWWSPDNHRLEPIYLQGPSWHHLPSPQQHLTGFCAEPSPSSVLDQSPAVWSAEAGRGFC